MDFSGADWLRASLKVEPCAFGAKVADILQCVFHGIYHLPTSTLRRIEWDNDRWIEFSVRCELATWDARALTDLVVLCHDECIRFSVSSSGPGMIRLMFHPRRREGGIAHRHPTIEQAIEQTRKLRDAYLPRPLSDHAAAQREEG